MQQLARIKYLFHLNLVEINYILKPKRKRAENMTEKKPIFDIKKARERIETGKRANWWQRKGSKSKGFKYFDKEGNDALLVNETPVEIKIDNTENS